MQNLQMYSWDCIKMSMPATTKSEASGQEENETKVVVY